MDIKKGKLNIRVSIAFKIATMLMAVLVKMALVRICGNEVNGLNALYLSMIGFLSVAELGVGTAITFCMYRPIVENDQPKVSALYQLFRKLYLLIGAVILIGGLAVMPFLPLLAKDDQTLDVNMYLTFLPVLLSVVLTYLFSAKTSLFNAYKNHYVTTAITQGGILLQYALQIAVLLVTRSFVAYLICRVVAVLVQWLVTEIVAGKQYDAIIKSKEKLDAATLTEVKKNVKAMFMHKVGSVLVNTADSVVISAFVGVVSLGAYSNYIMILSAMVGVVTLVFTSLTSVIGHLCVEEGKETARVYSESFHLLNFLLGTVFFLGYYAVIDNLIALLFSATVVVPKSVSFVITLNGFVQFMRYSTLTFKDATGTFYQDRWKPLGEGILNVILSVLFVNLMGVVGVILATVMTNLLICHVVEPYVLYKNAFSASPRKFYVKNYGMILAFSATLFGMSKCLQNLSNEFAEMMINGCISLGFSGVLCLLVLAVNRRDRKRLLKLFKEG